MLVQAFGDLRASRPVWHQATCSDVPPLQLPLPLSLQLPLPVLPPRMAAAGHGAVPVLPRCAAACCARASRRVTRKPPFLVHESRPCLRERSAIRNRPGSSRGFPASPPPSRTGTALATIGPCRPAAWVRCRASAAGALAPSAGALGDRGAGKARASEQRSLLEFALACRLPRRGVASMRGTPHTSSRICSGASARHPPAGSRRKVQRRPESRGPPGRRVPRSRAIGAWLASKPGARGSGLPDPAWASAAAARARRAVGVARPLCALSPPRTPGRAKARVPALRTSQRPCAGRPGRPARPGSAGSGIPRGDRTSRGSCMGGGRVAAGTSLEGVVG